MLLENYSRDYDLNEDNFLIYAAKAYDRPICLQSEMEDDLERIKYIKRLISKYLAGKELNEQLILNHIIILANVFGIIFTVKALYMKTTEAQWPVLRAFFVALNYDKEIVKSVKGKIILSNEISIDSGAVWKLRSLIDNCNKMKEEI